MFLHFRFELHKISKSKVRRETFTADSMRGMVKDGDAVGTISERVIQEGQGPTRRRRRC